MASTDQRTAKLERLNDQLHSRLADWRERCGQLEMDQQVVIIAIDQMLEAYEHWQAHQDEAGAAVLHGAVEGLRQVLDHIGKAKTHERKS